MPCRCRTSTTTRDGKVKRIQSRNHPQLDGGWLCDKGRFSYPHLYAEDGSPSRSAAAIQGLEPISWDAALDEAEHLLRTAGSSR